MVTDARTPNRNYALPVVGNKFSEDLLRLIAALTAIDADMATALLAAVSKAPLSSPNFTDVPTAPTAVPGTDTNQLATTAFVRAAVSSLIDSSPGALDTLNELAAALGDDPNFAATITTLIATKADTSATAAAIATKLSLAGGAMTGRIDLATSTATLAAARLATGLSITSPSDGDVWRRDADGGLRFRKAAQTVTILDSANSAKAIIEGQLAQGTGGGSAVAGAWTVRLLNTEVYDPYAIVSLSGNQFTPAFDCMARWSVPAFSVSRHKSRMYNATDSLIAGHGTTEFNDAAATPAQTRSVGSCLVRAGKTYQLEHRYDLAGLASTQTYGVSSQDGVGVFSRVEMERIP